MGSIQGQGSSGSDTMIDERKRKRMLSNRESARRSRMRKQKQVEDLMFETSQLQNNNKMLTQRINDTAQRYIEMETANDVLRAQAMELTNSLRYLNSLLQIVEDVSGMSVDIPEIPDPMLNPWQIPYPIQPITASADMFEF